MTATAPLNQYLDCKRCALRALGRRVVLGRGVLPATILMIGEAPGPSEELRGAAFIGRAGKILDLGIEMATQILGLAGPPPFYITNVLGCVPRDARLGRFRVPVADEVVSCRPRLARTVALAHARRVVFLGDVAEKEAKVLAPDGVKLRHPSYILRRGGTDSIEFRQFARGMADVFASVAEGVRA